LSHYRRKANQRTGADAVFRFKTAAPLRYPKIQALVNSTQVTDLQETSHNALFGMSAWHISNGTSDSHQQV
jgi:hypothetical protein